MTPRVRRLVAVEGLYAGLIGYAVVVVFFAVLNVFAGRSIFYTAAVFGAALFQGVERPMADHVTAGPVLAYNMVHMLGFLGLGMLGSWLVALAERHPVWRYVAFFALIFVFSHAFAALVLFAQPLIPGAAWLQIGGATLLAGIAMVWYLVRRHPLLMRELREIPIGSDEEAEAE